METKEFMINSNGKKIWGQIAYPDKLPCPAVILLHGFTNDSDDCPINKDLFEILPKKGYAAIEFDFIGSGKSDGLFMDKTLNEMYINFKSVLNLVKKDKNIKNIAVVGKSIKGIFPVLANDKRVKATALLSTAIRPSVQFYRAWETETGLNRLAFASAKNPKGELALKNKFFVELYSLEKKVLQNVPKIKNAIHFHGTADTSCPFDQGHFHHLKHTLPKPFKSVLIEGVGHQYNGQEELVINETISWFDKFLKN